eukprot:scaffold67019_cov19-Tisochrysis_lutea.AAC.1
MEFEASQTKLVGANTAGSVHLKAAKLQKQHLLAGLGCPHTLNSEFNQVQEYIYNYTIQSPGTPEESLHPTTCTLCTNSCRRGALPKK